MRQRTMRIPEDPCIFEASEKCDAASSWHALARTLADWPKHRLARFVNERRYRRAEADFSALPDRTLTDIGISRSLIGHIVRSGPLCTSDR